MVRDQPSLFESIELQDEESEKRVLELEKVLWFCFRLILVLLKLKSSKEGKALIYKYTFKSLVDRLPLVMGTKPKI